MRRRRSLEIIAGRVNADGSIAAGDGFSSVNTGAGLYNLTFPSNFRLVEIVANYRGGGFAYTQVSSISAAGVITVATGNASAVATNLAFSFIAVGAQV